MIPTYTNTTTSTNTSTNLVIPQQGGDYSEGTGGYVQTVRKGMAKTGASKGLRPGITQATRQPPVLGLARGRVESSAQAETLSRLRA